MYASAFNMKIDWKAYRLLLLVFSQKWWISNRMRLLTEAQLCIQTPKHNIILHNTKIRFQSNFAEKLYETEIFQWQNTKHFFNAIKMMIWLKFYIFSLLLLIIIHYTECGNTWRKMRKTIHSFMRPIRRIIHGPKKENAP